MSRSTRIVLVLLSTFAVAVVASVGATAVAVYSAGTVEVDVRPAGGGHVSVALPASVAEAAAAVLPGVYAAAVPRDARAEVRAAAGPWLPLADDVVAALERAGDARLLHLRSPDLGVLTVDSSGGRLVVDLDGADGDRVHVAVPLRLARRVVSGAAAAID